MAASPHTNQYAPLEDGESNDAKTDGLFHSSRSSARRIGRPRTFALGAAVLLGLIYMLTTSYNCMVATTQFNSLNPLSSPREPDHPAPSSPQLKSPTSYEDDPNPSGTVHCTVPHPGAPPLVQYALMIDAGSTGSRIHVYKFHNCDSSPTLEYETFKMTRPGLSTFAARSEPLRAARSLDVLLAEAVRVVPKELHKCTPVAVKATAGLRMTGVKQSEAILKAVYERLQSHYDFPVHDGERGVAIMNSAEEGVYAWVTAKYLLGASAGSSSVAHAEGPHAVLDLGGASTHIVFEPAFTNDRYLEDGEHKYALKLGGTNHTLYQHSHIGYGLMRVRAQVHQLVDSMASARLGDNQQSRTNKVIANPCLAQGTRRVVEVVDPRDRYRRWNVNMSGADVGSFEACKRVVEVVMNKNAACAVEPCSFDGVYQPTLHETFPAGKVLLLSYFYDRLDPLHQDGATQYSVSMLARDAKEVCAGESSWKERWGKDEMLMQELRYRSEWCLDLTFMHTLLTVGYGFAEEQQVTIVQEMQGIELGWSLGVTLAVVTGELTCKT